MPRNTAGRTALALGIIGMVTSLVVVGGLVGVAAIVFGIRGRSLARSGHATNPGMATAGIAAGVLSIFIAVAVVGTWTFFKRYGDDYQNYQECVNNARTSQDENTCRERFRDDVRRGADLGGTPSPSAPTGSGPTGR